MVVSSLIKRIVNEENPLKVWGDGTAIRDFIFRRCRWNVKYSSKYSGTS